MGVGRKDSLISIHDRINDSKFSAMVDYRCANHTGSQKVALVVILSGILVLGREEGPEETTLTARLYPNHTIKLPLEKMASVMAGNLPVRKKALLNPCDLHAVFSSQQGAVR